MRCEVCAPFRGKKFVLHLRQRLFAACNGGGAGVNIVLRFYGACGGGGGGARVRRISYCGVEMEHDVDVWMRRREVGESEANMEFCDRAAVGGEE